MEINNYKDYKLSLKEKGNGKVSLVFDKLKVDQKITIL